MACLTVRPSLTTDAQPSGWRLAWRALAKGALAP